MSALSLSAYALTPMDPISPLIEVIPRRVLLTYPGSMCLCYRGPGATGNGAGRRDDWRNREEPRSKHVALTGTSPC